MIPTDETQSTMCLFQNKHSLGNNIFIFYETFLLCYSLTNKVVALKEIRLQQEEGTPFTAIREGSTSIKNFVLVVILP